jgi:AcrR family transcriptional regulator
VPTDTRGCLVDAATGLLDSGGVSHNAPYKHFPSKEALLAAIAARELDARVAFLRATVARAGSPRDVLRAALRGYIAAARQHPARFKLVYGAWTTGTPELTEAATAAHATLIDIVTAAQDAGDVPAGDPERMAALVRALAHGAADLAAAGHLRPDGKGHAGPADLVDDLLEYLGRAAR